MTHPHTLGREIALQYLFMHDLLEGKEVQDFEKYLANHPQDLDPLSVAFAQQLIDNVIAHGSELDAEITQAAANWEIKRMAAVDRNIIRLGLSELISHPEISHKVIINEAVELAKRYSSDDAGSFVNGVLDTMRAKVRPQAEPASEQVILP